MPKQARAKKRPDGLYQTSITTGRKPDGSPIRKTIYAKTIRELENKAAEFRRQLAHGLLSSSEKMTFGELSSLWIENYKPTISSNSLKMYRGYLNNHLNPPLMQIKLRELKPHHLQTIINELAAAGYAEKNLKEIRMTAVQILNVAIENDVLMRNVFSRVSVPSIGKESRRALTDEETALIGRTWQGHRMGVPTLLMRYCGLRRGELLALTWADIDMKAKTVSINKAVSFDNNRPSVKTPKTKAGIRMIPIPDAILPALNIASKARGDSIMVCPSIKGGDLMSLVAFQRAWQSYQHYLNLQAGGKDASRSRPKIQVIDNITPHMLRHTYATMLYTAGVDVKSAQKYLGHANLEVTLKIYTHLSNEKEQQSISALNNFIKLDAVKMQ